MLTSLAPLRTFLDELTLKKGIKNISHLQRVLRRVQTCFKCASYEHLNIVHTWLFGSNPAF